MAALRRRKKPPEPVSTHPAPIPSAPRADSPGDTPFPIVGIGASAGGLEAFTAFLKALPPGTGMAFVLVQHMDPTHESMLSRILGKTTSLPVDEVTGGMTVQPDHVYVAPPDADITIHGGVLKLSKRKTSKGIHLPIDVFLTSLAEDQKSAAIGVVLSGIASDGTLGLKAIKEVGGITFAQDEKSARHSGMPLSAVAAGCVDFILPPERIAEELVHIGQGNYIDIARRVDREETEPAGRKAGGFEDICRLLRKATGVNFLDYKPTTIRRRIARRMVVKRMEDMDKYAGLLAKTPEELHALYQDILIHVTSFFRDEESFQALQSKVLSRIPSRKPPGEPVRMWVPGCSSGEEVYSIAILLMEALPQESKLSVQIFGTDISERAIEEARAGFYREPSLAKVSPERLRRFFTSSDGGYRVIKPIRDLCVFARHDLTKDPPFSKLDLISCRNVLIYLGVALQKKIVEAFHYALRPSGYLFLGESESLSGLSDLFAIEDKKHKIFSRQPVASPRLFLSSAVQESPHHAAASTAGAPAEFNLRRAAEKIILESFSPAAVVVDQNYQIIHFQGDTSPFLSPATGEPSFHLLRMLRPDLLLDLRSALMRVKKRGKPASAGPIPVKINGGVKPVFVHVAPLRGRKADALDFLVAFQPGVTGEPAGLELSKTPAKGRVEKALQQKLISLEKELESTREYLRSVVEDQETTTEELKSANEEVLSSNEELQSTNEELETAKEELQSTNEELTTLNEELQNRNAELGQLANDLSNLLVGANIPVLILGSDLRIRRFTPMAGTVLNLIPADVGRPFSQIASTVNVPDLPSLLNEVIDHFAIIEREVQDQQGRWYTLRMRPYKTGDNKIDGVLIALLDIDVIKRSLVEVQHAREYAEAIVQTVPEPFLVLDSNLRVLTANELFHSAFSTTPASVAGLSVFQLAGGQWNLPQFRNLIENILPSQGMVKDHEVVYKTSNQERYFLITAREIRRNEKATGLILLGLRDITEARAALESLRESEASLKGILESSAQSILTVDVEGRIRSANPATEAMFGHYIDELIGQQVEILIPEPLRSSHVSYRRQYIENPSKRPMGRRGIELQGLRKDGSVFPLEVSLSSIDTSRGLVAVAFVSDITERVVNIAAMARYSRQLRALTSRLINAHESERKHIARELHDVLSQKMAALSMQVSALAANPPPTDKLRHTLSELGDIVGEVAQQMQLLSRQLHPSILYDLGLAKAAGNDCRVFSKHHGIPVNFQAANLPESIPADTALCLYRVLQESLYNIGKHAGAKSVEVILSCNGEEIVLEVTDFGDGFDLLQVRDKGGLGLISMEERVRTVDGRLSIWSEPGKGTRVEARVPLGENKS
ncbi:MAG: PAS domain S-box protein [Bryobacterales bacterium]|nr:PAS domain S-box protein [Bryobacterales bacterium]